MSSYLYRNREFQKNTEKIQKVEKNQYGLFSNQNKLGKVEKE